jgi:hypothetical protein
MTRRAFHRALVAAGLDTWPFWETVMMCSLAGITPLYARGPPLYDLARALSRAQQRVVRRRAAGLEVKRSSHNCRDMGLSKTVVDSSRPLYGSAEVGSLGGQHPTPAHWSTLPRGRLGPCQPRVARPNETRGGSRSKGLCRGVRATGLVLQLPQKVG